MIHRSSLLAPLACGLLAPALAAQTPTPKPGFPVDVPGVAVSSPLLVDLDGDPDLELVQVIGGATTGSSVIALDPDGTPVPGWPRTSSEGSFGAPAAGDIDGDGDIEIVFSSFFFGSSGSLYAFHHDGTTVAGFPLSFGGPLKNPVLGDVDGDGDSEIVAAFNVGAAAELHVLQGDGSSLPGWPRTFAVGVGASPAVGDVDGDGIAEIFAPSFERLYGFDALGNTLQGFPFDPGTDKLINYSTPTLADMTGNGEREIVFASCDQFVNQPGAVWILRNDARPLPGWPKATSSAIFCPPTVVDLDQDGSLDVLVGDQLLTPNPVNSIYAWRVNGTSLPGFPYGPTDAHLQQFVVADVDGDADLEVLYECNVAGTDYLAIHHDGTPVAGWPLFPTQSWSSFNQQLSVADVDNDGLLDIAGTVEVLGANTTKVFLWDTPAPFAPELAPVPTHMYGRNRDGVADSTERFGVRVYGTGVNPFGSLKVLAGTPMLGDLLTLGVDNPLGTQTAGATLLALCSAPAAGFPGAGLPFPGTGMAGPFGPGELLVSIAPPNPLVLFGPAPWSGVGSPSPYPLLVPDDPSFVGNRLYFQGVVVDLAGAAVTNGLEVTIGY